MVTVEPAGTAGPLLSIVIPAFNERVTVRALLEKVWAVSFEDPVEVIVVDDGSSDGTREILCSLKGLHDTTVVFRLFLRSSGALA